MGKVCKQERLKKPKKDIKQEGHGSEQESLYRDQLGNDTTAAGEGLQSAVESRLPAGEAE